MDEPGEGEEFKRCSRNGSGGWRCKEMAMSGRSLCERHYLYSMERNKRRKDGASGGARRGRKRKAEDNSENGVVSGGEVVDEDDDGGKGLFGDHHNGGPSVVEEFAGLFGEAEGNGGLNLGHGVESFNLWHQGEEGQQQVQVQVGGFGNLGQVMGGGVEFECGYAENMNRVAGLGQPWSSEGALGNAGGVSDAGKEDHGSGAGGHGGVCENDLLGFPSGGIEGLIGEAAGLGSLYDRSFQALLCQDRGCVEDVIFLGDDGTGFQGLSGGESAYEFRGEELSGGVGNPPGHCGKFEGENVGSSNIEVPGLNNKVTTLGVEEGMELLLSGGVSADEEARGEALRPLAKDKQLDIALDGQTIGGRDNAETIGMSSVAVLETERSVFSGEKDKAGDEGADPGEIAMPKQCGQPKGSKCGEKNAVEVSDEVAGAGEIAGPKQRARPKGSKNKQDNIVEVSNEVAGAGEITGPKKLGRPKGSKNKQKSFAEVSNEVSGAGEIARPKKRGKPKGSKCKQKSIAEVSNEVAGAGDSEIAGPKKLGRPKGSTKKRVIYVCASNNEGAGEIARQGSDSEDKVLRNLCQNGADEFASLTNELGPALSTRNKLKSVVFEGQRYPGMTSDIHVKDDGGIASVWPSGSESTILTSLCEQEKGMPSEATKHIENIINRPIVKHGRPKGSRNKKIKLAGQEMPIQTLGQNEVQNDNNYAKPKRGRPKGSKNKKKNIAGEAGNKFVKVKKKRGRPKGSYGKKKEAACHLDSQIERHGLVGDKDGRTSDEPAFKNDIDLQKGNYSQERGLRITRQTIKYSQLRGLEGQTATDVAIEDEIEPLEDIHRSRMNVTGQPFESQKSTRFSKVLSRIMSPNHIQEESISMLEDQVIKNKKSDFVLECSKEFGVEKITKGLMCESGNVQKTSSERQRILLIDHKDFQGVEVEETIDHGLESSGLMVSCPLKLRSCPFNLISAMSTDNCTMAVVIDFF